MRFGSEEVTGQIIDGITDPSNTAWREELMSIVDEDTRAILRQYVHPQDLDDLVQEVQLKVLKNLQGYYRNIHNYGVAQRNSWLRTIATNTRNSFYRRQFRRQARELEQELDIPDYPFEREERRAEALAALYKVIQILANVKNTPDRCLAFLLNRLSSIDRGRNGQPQKVAKDMENLPLGEVFHEVKLQFAEQLNGELPDDLFQPLWEKVKPVADQPFHLNADTIRRSSSKISETLAAAYQKEE